MLCHCDERFGAFRRLSQPYDRIEGLMKNVKKSQWSLLSLSELVGNLALG